jgi:nucleoid-associated protein
LQFVIHELLKDTNGPVRERFREALITPTEEEESFVREVTRLFRRHQSGRIYGSFEPDSIEYPFSGLMRAGIETNDFYNFSIQAATLLISKMRAIPAATGGYFFACRFLEEEEDVLLLFMLSQRQSHAVDEATLSLRRSVNLQMDQLDLAARISITGWQDGRPEPVSLIRGRKEVSEYFKSFVGLHEPRTNTEGTQKLKDFTERWMEDRDFSRGDRENVRESILEYAKRRGDEPIELQVVASYVDPEHHQEFFVAANEVGLGAEFHIDRRSLKPWVRINYSDEDIKLNFPRRLLNRRVKYSSQMMLSKQVIELPFSC